jgi:hypothetical protein
MFRSSSAGQTPEVQKGQQAVIRRTRTGVTGREGAYRGRCLSTICFVPQ